MPKKVSNKSSDTDRGCRPAINPEIRDNQLISLAVDLAEQQLRDGTASAQVITHYLKLAASREKDKIELDILSKQKELVEAKTESLKSAQRMEEMYMEAMKAFSTYSGKEEGDYHE